jgi:Ricin-type beta-trefoil lectin domain
VDTATHNVYVANSGDDTVSVISPAGPASGPIVSGYRAGNCVADSGDSAANDTPVTMAACDGSAGQDWTVTSSGTLQVNGKCMDIYRDQKTNKAPVELWTCTGGANQQWHATAGTLVNPVSGKCLDDPRWNTTPGTRLELYTCNGGANQQWEIR